MGELSRVFRRVTAASDSATAVGHKRLAHVSPSMDNQAIYHNEILEKALTYEDYPIRIFTGTRGTGKTTLVQSLLSKAYLKRGQYFMLFRESAEELAEVKRMGFWDSHISDTHKDHVFGQWSNLITIDGQSVGAGIALTTIGNSRGVTTSNSLGKSTLTKKQREELGVEFEQAINFSRYSNDKLVNFLFDEFIPLTPKLTPLRRLELFKHALETFCRMRSNVRVYLCGNLYTPSDPFLDALGFNDYENREYGIRTTKKDGKPCAVWAHVAANALWQEARKSSIVTKFGGDSTLFESGAFKDISYPRIEGTPKRTSSFHLSDGERTLTAWRAEGGTVHITAQGKARTIPTFVFSSDKIGARSRLIDPYHKDMIDIAIRQKRIYFDSYATYEAFNNIYPKLRR